MSAWSESQAIGCSEMDYHIRGRVLVYHMYISAPLHHYNFLGHCSSIFDVCICMRICVWFFMFHIFIMNEEIVLTSISKYVDVTLIWVYHGTLTYRKLLEAPEIRTSLEPWWHHQMETFYALLALCTGNSPVTGEFPAQRPVTWSFYVFFDLHLNKLLCKQSWGWWFERPSRPLRHHCYGFN